MKLIGLLLLTTFYCLSNFAQWGDDNFVFDDTEELSSRYRASEPSNTTKSIQKNKRKVDLRKPASFDVEVKKSPSAVQDNKKLDEEIAKNIVLNSDSNEDSKSKSKSKNLQANESLESNWEAIKSNYKGIGPNSNSVENNDELVKRSSANSHESGFRSGVYFGYSNFSAKSSSYPKQYSGSAIITGITASLQFTKSILGTLNYETSFGMSTKDATDGTSTAELDHSWLEMGIEWEKPSDTSNSKLFYQLGYREWEVSVPKTSELKLGHKTGSFFLGARAEFAQSEKSSVGLKLNIFPLGSHKEVSSTWTANSGTGPKVFGEELEVDYTYRFSSENILRSFISVFVENVRYKGSTSANDPVLGQTIDKTNVRYKTQSIGVELVWYY